MAPHGSIKTFSLGLAMLSNIGVMAADCRPPPVADAEQASCLARKYMERSKDPWELACRATPTQTHWLVICVPRNHKVRGGGGEFTVDRATGVVEFIRGYR